MCKISTVTNMIEVKPKQSDMLVGGSKLESLCNSLHVLVSFHRLN